MAKEEKSKKKKLSTSGKSTREKMLERKRDLEKKNSGGFVFPKEGVTRVRLKSPGDDEEIGIEVVQFYLSKDLGGVISPETFGEPCPFMEKYLELKDSKDDDDKALAKKLIPKRKYALAGDVYKDEKGKEVESTDKPILVARGVYQDIIELYLDEDEWGDMTDPKEGYDLKITRAGKGQLDTTYTVSPCQKKPIPKDRQKKVDLEKMVRVQIPSYDELEETLKKFLNEDHGDDDVPVKSKKKFKPSKDGLKKKKKVRDI